MLSFSRRRKFSVLADIASEFGELRGARPAWRGQIGTGSRKTFTLINCSSVSSIGMPPPGSFPPPVPPPGALPPGIPPAMPPPPMPPGAGGHGPPAAGTPGAGHPGHGHSHPHPFPPGGIPHPGEYSLLEKEGMSWEEELSPLMLLSFVSQQ